MDNVLENHAQLLRKWKDHRLHRDEVFISDGIIDPGRWLNKSPKVHFLLKEAHSDKDREGDWDLCGLIRDDWRGPRTSMWHRLARWAYLVNYTTSSTIPDYQDAASGATEALLASSFSNIKKSKGASKSNMQDLAEYVSKDGNLIREQIEILNPDVIVCGYTWGLVSGLWEDAEPYSDLVFRAGGRLFIDFWHPANRYPNELNYYALGAIIQQAKRKVV